MGLFGKLFYGGHETVALIDVTSGSVAGGYLVRDADGKMILVYSARVSLRPREGEALADAMLRSLTELGGLLIEQGAPALRRKARSAHIGSTLISIGAPWQKTSIRIERIREKEPFNFTRSLMDDIVAKTANLDPEYESSEEAVIATMLNGYETSEPFGKRPSLADIVILSSSLPRKVADSVRTFLRKTFHTRHHLFTTFVSSAYTVFRDVYPHEHDFLLLDVTGATTDIAFVQRGLLVSVMSAPLGTMSFAQGTPAEGVTAAPADHQAWLESITQTLRAFSEEHALPRTVFLLAEESSRNYIREALDTESLRSLWLSDEPLTIIPVVPGHFTPYLGLGTEAAADVALMILALFHGKRIDRYLK